MGTKVHCKSYVPGYYSMKDLNEDSSSSSWPVCYGDKAMTNGQYYNGFVRRTIIDGYAGYEKDVLKQKMLEHEAVFKNQVYELHRLYRTQRDMMEEVKRKEIHRLRVSMEPSSSSSLRGSQVPSEDAWKWHMAGFPLSNPGYDRTPISRVEVVNSPMSSTKGNNTQPGHFPFQNGSSLKDSEPLDSRPLKVRKKLFDLELPAHEYIDTEEGEKLPECNVKSEAESSMKLSLGGHAGVTTDCRVDESVSSSRLRNSIRLADLNEPIEIEEAEAPSSVDFLGRRSINGETKGVNRPAKSNAGCLGVQETGFLINSSTESKVSERGRFSHLYEPGSSKSNLSSVTHGIWQGKLHMQSNPMQHMLNRVDHPPGIYPTGHSREDSWRERNHHCLESSDRSRANCNNGHFPPLLPSQAPGLDPFFSSSCFARSGAHSGSSWAKPTSTVTQKITTLESCLNSAPAMGRSSHTSAQSQEPFGGKWRVSTSSRLNPSLGGELTTPNGFYHGSASGSKELKVQFLSAGFDQGFGYFSKGSDRPDSKPSIDLNLNEVVSSNEVVILQDRATTDGKSKPEDHLPGLPWLKHKPAHANEFANQSCCKSETVTDLNQPFTPKVMLASSDCEIVKKNEIAKARNMKKILGFPIFETGALKQEPESHVSISTSVGCPDGKGVYKERKNRVLDINLECEPDEPIAAEELTVEKEKPTKGDSIRDFIDLNSCVSDCEDPSAPSYERRTASVKKPLEIDLEVPVPMESEDDNTLAKENTLVEVKNESLQDEVLRDAAKTIVAISSSCPTENSVLHPSDASLAESLLWLVEALSSGANELESTSPNESTVRDGSPKNFPEEMDDFEAMTLQLQETKEEDYMPVPFVPEVQTVDDTGASSLPTRTRRGQSRRGRQRRDFQRDILPGLASLSRHEVTEDLQTFGGLMKATGHHWVSGLTRRNGTRNGGARGRRRAVVETVPTPTPTPVCTPLMQQLNGIEAGLEDRSLTGWGKTTRRPRRQRCPAGNPPAVVLT